MRVTSRQVVILLLLLLLVPLSAGESASLVHRHLERMLASPLPFASDAAAFHVDVPLRAVVQVDARSSASSVFLLHFHRDSSAADAGSPTPASAQSALLGTGAWSVTVDPLAGALVQIDVTFRGFVSDVGGAPADFGFYDVAIDRGCVSLFPEVCLP